VEDVKWTVVAGIVNDSMVISVRNLGYTKNAGEFVRRFFAGIGSAGGHRAMAKAVIPMRAYREKFPQVDGDAMALWLHDLVEQFLHDTKEGKNQKVEVKSEV
jgi:nanoRNase/pAp phosphatase (c-di-AMP/oligoRNAs hydrolase)